MSSVNPVAFRRLVREITKLQNEPPEGIRIQTDEENILDVTGIIQGPDGTPYEGGYFRIKFKFGEEFPAAPPKCWFQTKIFHPNVSAKGEICVNTLKKDWKKEYGIAHILVTVKCLLIYPNPESALDEMAGKMLLEKYEDYCKHAKVMTAVHATPKVRPPEFDVPSVIPEDTPQQQPAPEEPSTSSLKPPPAPIPSPSKLPKPQSRHNTPAPTPLLTNTNTNNTDASQQHHSTKPVSKSSTSTSNPNLRDQNVDPSAEIVTEESSSGASGKKRSGAGIIGGAEKRKKGLKRL